MLVVSAVCCAATVGLEHSSQADVDPMVEAGKMMTEVADYVHSVEAGIAYVQAEQAHEFEGWLAGELVKYVQSVTKPVTPVNNTARTNPVVTNSGPHSDAWWHGVAVCEQGGRNDAYFGYFSFMDGSQGGKPWDQQVAAGNALLRSAGREVGPWAAACVAAGYRASPGG
jgi:hypothetical protein